MVWTKVMLLPSASFEKTLLHSDVFRLVEY